MFLFGIVGHSDSQKSVCNTISAIALEKRQESFIKQPSKGNELWFNDHRFNHLRVHL